MPTMIEAANASSSPDAFLVLLTITAGALPPLRVVNNMEDVVSRGDTFMAYPFSVVLANASPDAQATVQVTIDNVDRAIIDYIRGFETPPDVRLEIVLSSSPDRVDRAIDFLRLASVTYDALSVTGTLLPINFLSAPAVAEAYTGSGYPSLVWA